MNTLNALILNILIYCTIPISAIFIVVSNINKAILKKNGYKVTFLWMSLSDIKKMNELSKEKTDLRPLYYGLLISTIGFLSLFLLAFILVISDIILRR